MNDDEMKKLWQQQPLRNPDLSPAQLVSAMQSKMTQFRRDLAARDVLELLACVFVVIIFGYYFVNERSSISRLGWLIVVGSTIFIAGKLVHARRTTQPAPPGATLLEALRAELSSVRAQSRLLGSVLWWYLLPPGIGLLVATWGMRINLHAKIPATLVYIAIYAFVYWLNKRARTKQLLPMEAELESLLHSAETGESLDPMQMPNLRPIALSLEAASQIKPAEFKIAFWQIALFAEIGFVGFWFFFLLGQTEGKISQMFLPQKLVWIVPCFLGGLLFSWALQKGTERAVGISTLGVHLARGQFLILWDEIREVRPLRVLHIRSLWLIRESGQKAILPWTGLERHADLKAAVESCAPANHPIRKYISLLT